MELSNKSEAAETEKLSTNNGEIIQKQRRPTMVDINQTLPAEIIRQIFQLLSPRDLKAVVLVCRWT